MPCELSAFSTMFAASRGRVKLGNPVPRRSALEFRGSSAMARPWYQAPARSFSRGCRCGSSRTLVLTDLLANPEPGKVNRLLLLLLKSIGGIAPPYGGVSRDLRLNFTWRHRHELEAAVQMMLSWEPERIIFAHGRWYDANGTTE